MKLSAFMLAFIVSTAIHVGALTSNLLHVNAESIPDNKIRTVKLHIVHSAFPRPAVASHETIKERIEKTRTPDPDIRNTHKTEPLEDLREEMPAVNLSEISLPEKNPVSEKPPSVRLPVYREKSAIPEHAVYPSESVPEPLPTVTKHSIEQFQEAWVETSRPAVSAVSVSGSDACEDCSASIIAASSLVAEGTDTGGGDIDPTIPATITLSSKPTYPRYSRLHKEEGTTVLSVEILPDGKLGNVEVVRSSGYRRLDRAAVEGMQKAELVPALKGGRRVAAIKRISIRFDLEDWGE